MISLINAVSFSCWKYLTKPGKRGVHDFQTSPAVSLSEYRSAIIHRKVDFVGDLYTAFKVYVEFAVTKGSALVSYVLVWHPMGA